MEDPVPLEICPWWSGIYALHDVYRAGGEGNSSDNKVPAILSAYITEFGDCCLLMHVLDYTHIEGGSIAWCNWTGVGYRGGNRVSLYARDNEGWDLHFTKEVEVNNDEADVLSMIYDQILERHRVVKLWRSSYCRIFLRQTSFQSGTVCQISMILTASH